MKESLQASAHRRLAAATRRSSFRIEGAILAMVVTAIWCRAESGDRNREEPGRKSFGEGSAVSLAKAKADFSPLDCRWTFGNHEPISMYRRTGKRSTGGIEGGALWLEDWHHWFDSEECTRIMGKLGLNMLHSRFYKGMGWQFESKDFPRVRQFVRNCHRHGVRVLAYVQFSTLYYETMMAEVPDLEDWAALDASGRKLTYHGDQYWRWLPCINAPGFEKNLEKVIRIALQEGDFDGILFDNCFAPACYCPRCETLFREHLRKIPDPESRFGIPTVDFVRPPAHSRYGEAKDPVFQEWLLFRSERLTALFQRLYDFGKACKPSALMAGNVANIRRSGMTVSTGLNITDMGTCLDIFVSQSGNEPGIRDGCIVNRVREMKLARALGAHILALSDSDAGIAADDESKYLLNLMENAVFGGIPTDRMIVSPDKRDMVSREGIEFREPLLRRFNAAVARGRAGLEKPAYTPVRILYSAESVMFSEKAFQAILGVEEILLRNHVPYGLLPADSRKPLAVPADCEVLLVPDQTCLSDIQLASLAAFAEGGGRLIVTGESGDYDERYRERRSNPLVELDGRPGVIRRREIDKVRIVSGGWTIQVAPPEEGGRRLMEDLDLLWRPLVRIEAPETVLAEIKRDAKGFSIHLLDYASGFVPKGIRIDLPSTEAGIVDAAFSAPMESPERATVPLVAEKNGRQFFLPGFSEYAVVELRLP